jgi:hypothetical protein
MEELPMRKLELTLQLQVTLPEDRFKLNALLYTVKRAAGAILCSITAAILEAVQDREILELKSRDPERYQRNGYQRRPRRFEASFGTVKVKMAQMVDRKTGRRFCPLKRAVEFAKYRRVQEEAVEGGCSLVAHTSYRVSSAEAERLAGSAPSKSTLHRRLQEISQYLDPFGSLREVPFRFLMADATKVKMQSFNPREFWISQLRWAAGATQEGGSFTPVGFWLDTSWEDIRRDLDKRLDYGRLEVLFSDGELGIERLLADHMSHQRCAFHGKRDFSFTLYDDGVKRPDQSEFVDKLKEAPVFKWSQEKTETLKPEDRHRVTEMVEQTQTVFRELHELLLTRGYCQSATYINRLGDAVVTFLEHWLETGVFPPYTTNAIECQFSRFVNRVKHIGRRWSPTGLLNWLKMMFYKIFCPPHAWDRIWAEFLGLDPSFSVSARITAVRWIT